MADNTVEQVSDVEGLVARLREELVIEYAVPGPVYETLQNVANERGQAADAIETLLTKQAEDAKRIGEYREALGRIASNGFGAPVRDLCPKRDKDMLVMMDYARAALNGAKS